jgi:hypothetical protein
LISSKTFGGASGLNGLFVSSWFIFLPQFFGQRVGSCAMVFYLKT